MHKTDQAAGNRIRSESCHVKDRPDTEISASMPYAMLTTFNRNLFFDKQGLVFSTLSTRSMRNIVDQMFFM